MRKLLFLLVVVFLLSLPAHGATFPFANYATPLGSFNTTLVAVNYTPNPVTFNPWSASGLGAPPVTVAPYATYRVDHFPNDGSGLFDVDAPTDLTLYAEITYPHGVAVRVPALTKIGGIGPWDFIGPISGHDRSSIPALLDLKNDGTEWRSYVWMSSRDGAAFRLRAYKGEDLVSESSYILQPGDIQVVPVPTGADSVRFIDGIGIGGGAVPTGHVFAFAIVSHQPRGEVIPVVSPAHSMAWAQSQASISSTPTVRRHPIKRPTPTWSIAKTSPGSPLDEGFFVYLRVSYTFADELDVYQGGYSQLVRLDGSQMVADIPVMLRCDGTVGKFSVVSWRAGWRIDGESREVISIPPTC